ncbi:MAG: hypothetical protein WDN44_12560 [Sphingomonas sp.]
MATRSPARSRVDRDGDNRISFDELAGRFDLYFARFDADKDGVIVRSELVVLRPAGEGGFGGRRGKPRRGGR